MQYADRVSENTLTSGTGSLTLTGARLGYRTFLAGFAVGAIVTYTIDNGLGQWEVGVGTLTAATTLTRDSVIASSNANAKVNFPAGQKNVFATISGSQLREAGAIDVKSYGATMSVAQTDAGRRSALQAAIDAGAALGKPVDFGTGTWVVSGALRFRSNSTYLMHGLDITVFKLGETAPEDANVWEPYAFDSSVINVTFKGGFTCDGNYARATVTGVGSVRPGSTGFTTGGARKVNVDAVKAVDCVLHCIDICNGGNGTGAGEYIANSNKPVGWNSTAIPPPPITSTYHPANESQDIWIGLAIAIGGGDDGITTHYCDRVVIETAISLASGLRHPGISASNAIEVDDGSRNVRFNLVICEGANRGYAVKSHRGNATPYGIIAGQVIVENMNQGVVFDSDPYELTPTRRCQIGTIIVTKPTRVEQTSELNMHGAVFSNAVDITVGEIIARADGDEVNDAWGEPLEWGAAVQLSSSCKRIKINHIEAFNWRYSNTTDDVGAGALFITSTQEDVQIGSIFAQNCGWRAVVDTGALNFQVGSAILRGSNIAGSVGWKCSSANPMEKGSRIGSLVTTGYEKRSTITASDYEVNLAPNVFTTMKTDADESNSTLTHNGANFMHLPVPSGKVCIVEYFLMMTAAATTTGLDVVLDTGTDVQLLAGTVSVIGSGATPLVRALTGNGTNSASFDTTFSTTQPVIVKIEAVVRGLVAGGRVIPLYRSEVSGSLVTLKQYSSGRLTEVQ